MLDYIMEWAWACKYADECLPPGTEKMISDPFPSLAFIALSCIMIWFVNEVRLNKMKGIKNVH